MNDGLCNLWKVDTKENSENRIKLGIHPSCKEKKEKYIDCCNAFEAIPEVRSAVLQFI
jgi:hypothetical protein